MQIRKMTPSQFKAYSDTLTKSIKKRNEETMTLVMTMIEERKLNRLKSAYFRYKEGVSTEEDRFILFSRYMDCFMTYGGITAQLIFIADEILEPPYTSTENLEELRDTFEEIADMYIENVEEEKQDT